MAKSLSCKENKVFIRYLSNTFQKPPPHVYTAFEKPHRKLSSEISYLKQCLHYAKAVGTQIT